ETAVARRVLPPAIKLSDAVFNLQRALLLVRAIETGRLGDLREALRDRWHQPYRAPLVPGLTEALALDHPALLGVCLSGAGPSIVAFATDGAPDVAALLDDMYRRLRVPCTIRILAAHQLRVERYGRAIGVEDVWVKQCGLSHTGSFKDLGMTVLVSVVKQMIGDGARVRAVACASTGDTSASLAAYAAAAGIPAVVILPRGRVTPAQLVQPLANGARVLALDTDFDGCMTIVRRLAQEDGVYLANSMNSLRIEGQKTLSIDIVQQFGWEVPDLVVIPGGNLGNVSALGAGFDLMLDLGLIVKRPRIVVAQAAAANPLYRAYRNQWRFEPVAARR